jgi:cytosine/adenosine deaminase-related metal-dependent hydrolase
MNNSILYLCLVIFDLSRGPFDLFGTESTSEIFEKFIFLGDDRNIDTVFVNGEKVLENVVLK